MKGSRGTFVVPLSTLKHAIEFDNSCCGCNNLRLAVL